LIAEPFIASTQALNEFANVGKKKLGNSWTDTRQAVADIMTLSVHVPAIDQLTTLSALELAPRYNTGSHDALMLAAARLWIAKDFTPRICVKGWSSRKV
jgi:predicted nucleic acid-binding protein